MPLQVNLGLGSEGCQGPGVGVATWPAGEEDSEAASSQTWVAKAAGGTRGETRTDPPHFCLLPPTDPTDSGNFGFKNMLDARVEGEVDVPKTVKVTGTAGLSRNSTLEVQTLSVAPKALGALHEER